MQSKEPTAPPAAKTDRAPRRRAAARGSDLRLPPLLRRAWYGLNQAFRRRVAHLGLTPDQYTALRNLDEAGARGLTQSELTNQMSSDPNTIASLVERMESATLLRRNVDRRDRRARRLRLTPLGRRQFREAFAIAGTLQEEILSALPPARRRAFLETLQLISLACRSAADRT
ncbi:MAG: winged helix-turn-helix transcriptional regulator [Verrucomicrobiales bacterium]|nr:winged helix-turn-helix transcriptional regulator [Verrucomicrobiales bacterium]